MIKRHIEETVESYDENGKLTEKRTIITEESDTNYYGEWIPPQTNPYIQPTCANLGDYNEPS